MNITLPEAEPLYQAWAGQVRPLLSANTRVVGIRTGGVWLAERLVAPEPVGALDISFYRDDFDRIGLHPQVKPSALPFELDGADVLLIDDVLYTGRTLRAAVNALFDYGRPARIRLAVLIDRGGRELPFQADVVGWRGELPAETHVALGRDEAGHFCLTLGQQHEGYRDA